MADDYLGVDTGAIAAAVAPTREMAQRILDVKSALVARLSELGAPWGDDETGRQFLEQYQGGKNDLLAGFEGASEVLRSMADGVDTMAKGFQWTEEQNMEAASVLTNGVRSGEGIHGGMPWHGGKHS
ncbi:hypothetical protein ABZZ74_53040 [Streptomyces sp. NPDC006476]|uniref:WXG100 family type VII secretion target n=1 Tax=Streptomyces sp. NPDC006476 TaxID=3157175 RepID=UPI0033ACF47F